MATRKHTVREEKSRSKRPSHKPPTESSRLSTQRQTPQANVLRAGKPNPSNLTALDVQHLQRMIGNQSVDRFLSKPAQSLAGKIPGSNYEEEANVGGRTVGEFLGDIGRPVGTGLGNVVGAIAGALTGISISSNSLVGPSFLDNGHFDWGVMFNVTGGKAGWVVQEIENTFRGKDSTGKDLPSGIVPHYWEAWSVDDKGTIDPNFVDARGCDDWIRTDRGNNTEGHWSMEGTVYFTTTDPATQGLTYGGVSNAGGLLASTTEPAGLGVARLHRYAQGTWDSTGTKPYHTGSAGP